MRDGSYKYSLFHRSDFSAFWALFTDNLVNLMVLAGVCQFVFQMPAEIVYGRIVPGAGVAILARHHCLCSAGETRGGAARARRDRPALRYFDAGDVCLSVWGDRTDLLGDQ